MKHVNELDELQKMVDGMPLFELMVMLKAINRRLSDLLGDYGDNLVNGLQPTDAEVLPVDFINRLVTDGYMLQVGEAKEYSGYTSTPGLYAAIRTDNHPMGAVQVVERYLFTRGWINDYRAHDRKAGRPKKGGSKS